MKLAVLSESSADESAIRILVQGLLAAEPEEAVLPFRARRGFGNVLKILPQVLLHLYLHSDADMLAVVLDSDKSPVHHPDHDDAEKPERKCRFCLLRAKVVDIEAGLGIGAGRRPKRPDRRPLQVAIGLAVPQMEAWLLYGVDKRVGEAAWKMGMKSGKYPYTGPELKRKLYGRDVYTIEVETECMVREAQRLAAGRLTDLEQWFPDGFGPFAAMVRGWKPPDPPAVDAEMIDPQ